MVSQITAQRVEGVTGGGPSEAALHNHHRETVLIRRSRERPFPRITMPTSCVWPDCP